MDETASVRSVGENYDVFDNILNFAAKDSEHQRAASQEANVKGEVSCSGNEYSYSLPSTKYRVPASPNMKRESQPPSLFSAKRMTAAKREVPRPQPKSGQPEGILVRKDGSGNPLAPDVNAADNNGVDLDTSTELYENPFITRKPILGFTERIQKKPPQQSAILPENATTPMNRNQQKTSRDGPAAAAAAAPARLDLVARGGAEDDISATAQSPLHRTNAFRTPLMRHQHDGETGVAAASQRGTLGGNGTGAGTRTALTEAAVARVPDHSASARNDDGPRTSPRRLSRHASEEEEASRPGSRKSRGLLRSLRGGSVSSNNSGSRHQSPRRGSEGRSSQTSARRERDAIFHQLKKKIKGKK